jgi:Ca-activated chloride channel homolog
MVAEIAMSHTVDWIGDVWRGAMQIRFANPQRLWLLPLVLGFVVAWCFLIARQRQKALDKLLASVSPSRRRLKSVVFGAGALTLTFSLSRPQVIGRQQIEIRGMDVVVAVDASKSMMVADVAPAVQGDDTTRLARARAYADELITALAGDRFAPMVFANGVAHFPLTADAEAAMQFLHAIGPADLPQGSDVASAVRAGRCLLRPDMYDELKCSSVTGRRGNGGSDGPVVRGKRTLAQLDDDDVETEIEERGKAIVLITDGGDEVEPVASQVAAANALGILVFIVGIGSDAGGEVFDINEDGVRTQAKQDKDGKPIISRRDDGAFAKMLGDGKRYFVEAGKGPAQPALLVAALQNAARGQATKHVKRPQDLFLPFLYVGLLLVLGESMITDRRRKIVAGGLA